MRLGAQIIMPRRQLIVFSGLDGAGKSTQIDLLLAGLTAQGQRSRRIWARGGYTPLFVGLKTLLRRLHRRALPSPGLNKERERKFRSSWVRRTWLLVAILDLFLYYGIWVRILRGAGWHIVADRWIEDTALDFRLNYPEENTDRWFTWKILLRTAPQPDVHFVFLIPVEESVRRSKLKGEPFPDAMPVLQRRLHYYEGLAKTRDVRKMDGLRSREELYTEIKQACGLQP